MIKKTVTEFLDNDYKNFGIYTIENRAIPSVIDGFKPTQRKVIYIANKIWKTGNEKPLKIFQLTGKIASEAMYHHGSMSLDAAIIGMAQTFKNSIPLLDGIGSFGCLRSTEAGAPRYISAKINSNFKLLYKDFELLEKQYEEGIEIEPKYFLPIIPTVLLNGSSGIAVGYASNILNRNAIELIDIVLNILNNKKLNNILPYYNEFNGEVIQDEENMLRYIFKGTYNILNTTTVEISELPPATTFIKYETYLNKLIETNKIVDYENLSDKKVKYIIKFKREILNRLIEKNEIEKVLKLVEYETENLTCLDENNKLIEFTNIFDLIKYFVNFRLTFYDKRKKYLINKLKEKAKLLINKANFIKLIIDKKLVINNRNKKDIIIDIENFNIIKIEDSYDYLLNLPIYTLTKEKYEDIVQQIKDIKAELDIIINTEPLDMYKNDLKLLRKQLS